MKYETLLLEEKNQILHIRLNRPEAFNALNFKMIEELHEVLLHAETRSELRVVLMSGEGKAFCSGGDVKSFYDAFRNKTASDLFHHMPTRLHDMVLTMKNLDKPVLAAVNGAAVGAGFSLAIAADLLIAAESAYFMLGYLKIGLSPDGSSTVFLPKSVGVHKAFELLTLGEKLSAVEAKNLGFVAKVFPDATFKEEVQKLAQHFAALPTQAVAMAKKLIFEGVNTPAEVQLNKETQGVKKIACTQDFFEGVSAFVEKRPPKFTGK